MTENLGLAALRGDEWLERPGSVGRGFRDTEIRITDDHGNPLGPGEFGEIYLRAPMTGGYRYIGGAAPLPTTADGFTSAGDLGHLDAEGYLYIADRRTDMIVSGGANVFSGRGGICADRPSGNRRCGGDRVGRRTMGSPRARHRGAQRTDYPAERTRT